MGSQRYTPEFKDEAVRLLERRDRPAAALTRDLGIKRNQLYRWREPLSAEDAAAFPGHGRRTQDPEPVSPSLTLQSAAFKRRLLRRYTPKNLEGKS